MNKAMAETIQNDESTLEDLVKLFQQKMAHAWMVRTFIKHCDEVEDYPELMGIVRAVFDMSRAIETKAEDPPAFFKFARKKLGKLKKAGVQFQQDAWAASTHTNFQQAVISVQHAADEMEVVLSQAEQILAAKRAADKAAQSQP